MTDIRDLSFEELRAALIDLNEPAYRAEQVFVWIFKKGAASFEELTDLPRTLREKLSARFFLRSPEAAGVSRSGDGTSKTLFRLADGLSIETVLIPSGKRRTICLSTQAGCKFACVFCASGLHGFYRNLTPAEILGQVLYLRDELEVELTATKAPAKPGKISAVLARGFRPRASGESKTRPLTNLVFMGMGEPLDNYENVEKALRILNDPRGFGFAARRMTVSTCGLVPGIELFKKLDLQVNLSISLHAADDETRSRLMPINRRYPLGDLIAACEDYLGDGGRKLTFEYVLIKSVNDRPADAERLAKIARRLRAKVNVIAYSPVAGLPFERPEEETPPDFVRRLKNRGVGATLRPSKGSDIQAACGQLAFCPPLPPPAGDGSSLPR